MCILNTLKLYFKFKGRNPKMSPYAVNIGVISNEVKTRNGPAFVGK